MPTELTLLSLLSARMPAQKDSCPSLRVICGLPDWRPRLAYRTRALERSGAHPSIAAEITRATSLTYGTSDALMKTASIS